MPKQDQRTGNANTGDAERRISAALDLDAQSYIPPEETPVQQRKARKGGNRRLLDDVLREMDRAEKVYRLEETLGKQHGSKFDYRVEAQHYLQHLRTAEDLECDSEKEGIILEHFVDSYAAWHQWSRNAQPYLSSSLYDHFNSGVYGVSACLSIIVGVFGMVMPLVNSVSMPAWWYPTGVPLVAAGVVWPVAAAVYDRVAHAITSSRRLSTIRKSAKLQLDRHDEEAAAGRVRLKSQ